jgi:hypothetical protein
MRRFLCLVFLFYFLVYSVSSLSMRLGKTIIENFIVPDSVAARYKGDVHIFVWEFLGSRVLENHGLSRHNGVEVLLRKVRAVIKQVFFWSRPAHMSFSEAGVFPLPALSIWIAGKRIKFNPGFQYSCSGLSPPPADV